MRNRFTAVLGIVFVGAFALLLGGCASPPSGPGLVAATTSTVAKTTSAPTTPKPAMTTPAPTPPITTTTASPPAAAAPVAPEPIASPTTAYQPPAAAVPAQPICGDDSYLNSDNQCVHRPQSAPAAPPGATARCTDGTYSYSQHRSGTCSHHGGVSAWL
ncbi:DUF3761 domain-containing protein [Nocardia sp. NPDC005998]|uniref:DUF3761 domain-containing protein n=1 Tax=Nocardia sp. NPDC005998 TaxID=3156894 RepID=UPI0033A422E2